MFLLCSGEFLGGILGRITRAVKSGKNVKCTAQFDIK